MTRRKHALEVVLARAATAARCFLCRRLLREVESSQEHVFPRWLLKRQKLYPRTLTLANGTSLRYSQLTVPCCRPCNEFGERALEGPISRAFQTGFDAVVQLDHRTLALWCLKIYYGIRFKEHLLPQDRRRPRRGKIVRRAELEEMRLLFMVLQGIRTEIRYVVEPWSLWVYRLKVPTAEHERFTFADMAGVSMFSIRIDDVGIIVLPRDFGLLRDSAVASRFDAFLAHTLHPQQFNELVAQAAYFEVTRTIGVSYLISFERVPLVTTIGSLAAHQWREWDWNEYHHLLSSISKIPVHVWAPDERRRLTFLEDADGNYIDIPLDAIPVSPGPDDLWQSAPSE